MIRELHVKHNISFDTFPSVGDKININTCRSDTYRFTFSFILMVKDSAYFLIRQIVSKAWENLC